MSFLSELLEHDQKSGLYHRGDRDIRVIKEQQPSYKTLMQHPVAGPYLDLGAYIGTFAWWAKKNLTPTEIISVEPFPSSVDVLRENFGADPTVTIYAAAVTHNAPSELTLYSGVQASSNSLEFFRGRSGTQVQTVEFLDLITQYKPVLIKCDIEGGEYGLPWDNLPDHVQSLAFEFHQSRPAWLKQQAEIDRCLLDQGFTHVRAPKMEETFHKNTIGVYWRG